MANSFPFRVLPTIDPSAGHTFITPSKRIHESQDVSQFLVSKAYVDIMTFLLQLNRAMIPVKLADGTVQSWPINTDAVEFSAPVRQLQLLLTKLEELLEEAPPDTGPRRFGNISFRRWYELVESRASELLEECLSSELLQARSSDPNGVTAEVELKAYFLGSLGSPQRLDYGTGHELSFLAFLAGIWKLNGFPKTTPGVEERAIVLGVIQPYLELVRTIIKRYTLEPAGSHGVWGLDDHSFIPYILGSAQLAPAISETDPTPEEGSLAGAPSPSGVAKAHIVERERLTNMYFSAIGFIYDVKKGPFWEHSPMLYDISGIQAGWGKINKVSLVAFARIDRVLTLQGMIKMYNAEVLSKFPVVQHFPFGSLFRWDRDPNAVPPPTSVHTSTAQSQSREPAVPSAGQMPSSGTRAPWATGTQAAPPVGAGTAAPWAARRDGSIPGEPPTSLPDTSRLPPGSMAPTRAPWAASSGGQAPGGDSTQAPTKAPWAK
ncbi:serine/threonine-protein phosphatase 2A activator 1 [Aspergillus pseudoviridinutans]|uniref:Serine/threonine-protein phosphatase 2A activator n=1 Tax=Aspergillus pseudoviridinutans TaxID=1517512 RepID=A0A9P3BEK9_9EURO|nr:serine/threonine-protein phosphatase 2A activator 1 [Aspergillus pseudoviridinutans]GIJ89630.1 serine/threonine-protein phosphatase 2A activator 1 [Aspergillus pseudoviridinutans]